MSGLDGLGWPNPEDERKHASESKAAGPSDAADCSRKLAARHIAEAKKFCEDISTLSDGEILCRLADLMADRDRSRSATFDEVWNRLRPFLGSDYDTQQAIIVMDHFGWIDNGPCTCGLEVYGDPCPHHSSENAPSFPPATPERSESHD